MTYGKNSARTQQAFSALADPTRRAVFERLRGGPRAVNDIAAGMPVSRPAVSQHLKALKDAQLVTEHRAGTRRIYAIDTQGLLALRAYLDQFWDDALSAFAAHVRAQPQRATPKKRRRA